MASFLLRIPHYSPADRVKFTGGKSVREFLKPEEVGNALVSNPIELDILTESAQEIWADFGNKMEGLVIRGSELGKFCVEFNPGKYEYRMVIYNTAQSDLNDLPSKGHPEEVNLPVKVKLLSNISLTAPPEQREQGCLEQLTKVCEPQNLELSVRCLDAVRDKNPQLWNRIKLAWNTDELCWEAETQLGFKKDDLSKFEKSSGRLQIYVGDVLVDLNNAAVAHVLQRFYDRPRIDWRKQQELLERGEFADVEIVSKISETKKGFKCHRVQLAGASPVFAKMLEENTSGDDNSSNGPSEVKKGKWQEAQSGTVGLFESNEAIEALLHFLYYGGCQRIYRNQMNVIVELLEAGEKYEIPSLVDVTTFVLLADAKDGDWGQFSVETIMKLFHLSRNLEGKGWSDLKAKSFQMLSYLDSGSLLRCAEYRELYELADKVGPVYKAILESKSDDYDFAQDSVNSFDDCDAVRASEWTPDELSIIGSDVTQEEAKLVYEMVNASQDFKNPRNLDFAVGILNLAEFCGESVPKFGTVKDAASYFANEYVVDEYEVDYLVDLAYFAKKKKKGAWWKELNKQVVQLLKKWSEEQPEKVKESKKFKKMVEKKPLWASKKKK